MQKITLVLAVVGIGFGVVALIENRDLRSELESRELIGFVGDPAQPRESTERDVLRRLEAVEEDVARVDRVVTAKEKEPDVPGLEGRPSLPSMPSPDPEGESEAEAAARIAALVDVAVEKRTALYEAMKNKKPSLDAFAKALELTAEQRAATEAEVLRGQREIKALLETVSDEGTNFKEELVEVLATGMAKPGQGGARWGKLFSKLVTEMVPGTDQTYAEAANAVKQSVREGFRRHMDERQYARFEAWQMDPTEVQGIPGSPWEELQPLIVERARELGADIPDDVGLAK